MTALIDARTGVAVRRLDGTRTPAMATEYVSVPVKDLAFLLETLVNRDEVATAQGFPLPLRAQREVSAAMGRLRRMLTGR